MNIEEVIENRVMNLNFKGKLNNGGYIMKSKKILKMYISLALSCSIVFSNTSVLVNAIESRDRKVFANIGKDKISIGNDYIKREFSIDNGKVLTNLIENSLKYSTTKDINIEIGIDEGKGHFKIYNGVDKIKDEIKDILLEPFIKGDNKDRQISSSGLGLYICKRLCEKNNFNIYYNLEKDYIEFVVKFDKN